MLIIQTGEFVGMLKDVVGFAPNPKDAEYAAGVRLCWDGDLLHCEAADPIFGICARSSWHPGDEPDEDVADSAAWGANDEPWITNLGVDDAKYLIKVFALKNQLRGVPLHLTHGLDRQLRVVRPADPDTGTSAADHTVTNNPDLLIPDLKVLDDEPVASHGPVLLRCGPTGVKALAGVRTRAELQVGVAAAGNALLAVMGDRFRAAFALSDSRPAYRDETSSETGEH
jgi:hypothetical protein